MEPKKISCCIPHLLFRRILRDLLRHPYHVAVGWVGVNATADRLELLIPNYTLVHEGEVARGPLPVDSSFPSQPRFMLSFTPYRIHRPQSFDAMVLTLMGSDFQSSPVCHLFLGSFQEETGAFVGVLADTENIRPVHSIKLIGPGMREIPAVDFLHDPTLTLPTPSPQQGGRWSRTIGALGEESWSTLIHSHFCIVGCGRTGSLAATSLARLGVRHLTLIDPDVLQEHNLDSMDSVGVKDIGHPKAVSLADNLHREFAHCSVRPLALSVLDDPSLQSLKEAEVLVCCVDDDLARAVVGFLACLYARPLLDIGTGVLRRQGADTSAGTREMGADVRLVLPGEGCLFCWGGVADQARLQASLNRWASGRESGNPERPWHEERAGSLRSLNQIAVHLGIRMIEQLAAGSSALSVNLPASAPEEAATHLFANSDTFSRWIRLHFDDQGMPDISRLPSRRTQSCPLCRVMGLGDILYNSRNNSHRLVSITDWISALA